MLYLPRIEESDFGVPPKAFLLLPHYQWRTWDKIGLSSFPVFHNKLAVELGLESRSPNLGEFSISSDHVRLSSFFHKILLTWHMPSVLFYNRCFEGRADGLFPSPSQPLTPESQIMSEMALTALFPQRSTSPSAHPFCVLIFPMLKQTLFYGSLFLLGYVLSTKHFSVTHVLAVLTPLECSKSSQWEDHWILRHWVLQPVTILGVMDDLWQVAFYLYITYILG